MVICSAVQNTLAEFNLLMVRCSIILISKNLFEGSEATNHQTRSENNFKHLEHSTDAYGLFLRTGSFREFIKILVIIYIIF